jgi:acyl-CoA thioesterase
LQGDAVADSSRVPNAEDAATLARAVSDAMFARDRASQMMGMHIEAIGPGHARLTMRVRQDMLNGHGICHGGFIFTLADSTFAFACNSRNQNTLAAAAMIDFLAPGRLDDVLTAEACEQSLSGRTGIYDIVVTRADQTRIALFRGKSTRIQGEVIAGLEGGVAPAATLGPESRGRS